jgi:hypothetical protein
MELKEIVPFILIGIILIMWFIFERIENKHEKQGTEPKLYTWIELFFTPRKERKKLFND